MHIVIGNDHAGPALKDEVVKHLKERNIAITDLGIKEGEKIDYPVIAQKVATFIAEGKADLGIIICGTGIGVSIVANKVKGVRAACVSEPYSAKLSRQHNDANILCMGARVVGDELAKMIVDEFIDASFLGGRHADRVAMINELDKD